MSLVNRLEKLESANLARLKEEVEAKYGPVFDRYANSLTDEQLRYRELSLSNQLPSGEESAVKDWTIEAQLYQAFSDLNIEVPKEILGCLSLVEKELGLAPIKSSLPLDRINRVVNFLNSQLAGV